MEIVKKYGSFCPIAKAAEILTERWTLLVLRDMLQGSHTFTDLRRGIPQMSPTLLSRRLQTLEETGLVERRADVRGAHWEYHPTRAATELQPIILSIGHWGQRWARSQLTPEELNPGRLMWFMHRHFALDRLPCERIVLYVEISDARKFKRWWFLADRSKVELCWQDDPGYDVDISIFSDVLTLTQVFIGDLSLDKARSLNRLEVQGTRELVRTMPDWFPRSKFADDNPMPVAQVSQSDTRDRPSAKRVQKVD
jgi:DNA-binding HxlR family transcriptional regulator